MTTDTMRWRSGETNPVTLRYHENTRFRIGDLVCFHRGMVYHFQDHGDASNFLGVAMQASSYRGTGTIRVATSGVFDFPVSYDEFGNKKTILAGELVGCDFDDPQAVRPVSEVYGAIGSCYVPGEENALVKIRSNVAPHLYEQ